MKKLLFEMGRPGRKGYSLPQLDVPDRSVDELLPAKMQRKAPLDMPELSEGEVIRHYTELSTRNHGVDSGFYPLGSCTMKYNPKVNEEVAGMPGFALVHPLQDQSTIQGALELLYKTEKELKEVTGMDRLTFQPVAGAHGELTGLMVIQAYHRAKGEERTKVLVPDSAHGTNPATATMAGYDVVQIPSNEQGLVDVKALKEALDEKVAALMLTNPNTLGLFEEEILEISKAVHEVGGLLYYDGANLNAIMGYARPGDMGFDVVHLNLHKTFATPHGSGGPGSGPIGVKEKLTPFLPVPLVEKDGADYYLNYELPQSIGKVHGFYGNFGVVVKAYTYLRMMGKEGLKQASADAVLNANYLMERLKKTYYLPYDRVCKHEFVLSAREQKKKGAGAGDIAKALLDYGYHPPTVYFPLIVEDALMVEPTETEGKETLDGFASTMEEIAEAINKDPEKIKSAPHTTVVGRLNEVKAAREPRLRWKRDDLK
ncbi:Glycine dehydrogenase (decarboxylating) [Dethiobacter alkaliphilus AHT 1]|uniref:Probable glycine dehydrogenase (decarboxylating) subunit 2 n=2 Tax=Dethiobacter TaxID=427925 RepID=C0GKB0_DETAL|nr:Glycine dehydrogenase (decarboxylating) [Dethiobacter alkaliphilus AHT 1]